MSAASMRASRFRRPFVAGNWKMNGSIVSNEALLDAMLPSLIALAGSGAGHDPVRDDALRASAAGRAGSIEIAICPPFPYLGQLRGALAAADGRQGPIALGAQNVAAQSSGAFTGEVAAGMLVDLACRWVIVGHSERRAVFGETDEQVLAKVVRAFEVGLDVIVCVGESLAEREAGRAQAVVGAQLDAVVAAFPASEPHRAVVAYEPVWAIGTGKTATPEVAQEMHAFIRARLAQAGVQADATRLLYGGSVKAANAAELFSQPDIDGGLIGGAALQPDEFIAICRAAAESTE